jgi:hypothetical protein
MNQLVVIPPIAVPACLADTEIAAAPAGALARGPRGDASHCGDCGAVPVGPQATGGLKASTIGRRAAAIAYAHKLAGFEPPTGAETVKAWSGGIRRSSAIARTP